MGLQNLDFEIRPDARAGNQSVDFGADSDLNERFQYWKGASSERYIHTVYSLIGVPELPKVNYLLVYRDEQGRRHPLRVGRTKHVSQSLNLADIRFRAARLGANEVHIHMIAEGSRDRALVECDLRAGQFNSLSGERVGNRVLSGFH